MADTQRSLTDLLTVQFPNGLTEGAITAQTIRDLIVSLLPSLGAMVVTTPVPTVVATPGTYVKALGGTGLPTGVTLRNFSLPVANRMRYDGTVSIHCFVVASVGISAAAPNKQIGVKIAVNGVLIDDSQVIVDLNGTDSISSIAVPVGFDLNPTDFVELFVTNFTDTTNITMDSLYLHIQGGIK